MWWCCGKTWKDAPGCKFSKHETKDDEEDEKDKEEEEKVKFKNIKCYCCKENGHTAANCNRDPNIRSYCDTQAEITRIDKYKDFKKLNTDTFLFTNKLFEAMVKGIGE